MNWIKVNGIQLTRIESIRMDLNWQQLMKMAKFVLDFPMFILIIVHYNKILAFKSESFSYDFDVSSTSSFLDSVKVRSQLDCASICLSKSHCNNWYYDRNVKICYLQVCWKLKIRKKINCAILIPKGNPYCLHKKNAKGLGLKFI